MTTDYNIKNIRTLLMQGFTDDELRRLCFDIPDFRTVYDELSQNTGKARIVDRLIEYAERRLLFESLLTHARQCNPAQYEKHQPYHDLAYPVYEPNAPTEKKQIIEILFLAANPSDTTRLRLDEEVRAIDQAIRQAEFRDMFAIRQHWAIRVTDLQSYLLRHKPDIVHFSGHGSEADGIILEDTYGDSHPVSNQALSSLFSALKGDIRCIVLNACYSERHAQAIAEYIDCVIGMSATIGESAAISFVAAFYQALGYGKSVKTAFELGCMQIDLENLNEKDTPKLLAINANPEEITFV